MDQFSFGMLSGHLFLGLMNGSFYALLSLGLAIIFGMLHIVNFAHGIQYMLGAFAAVLLMQYFGLGYWWALIIAPLAVGTFGLLIELVLLRRVAKLNALYGMLLCIGLSLIVQGVLQAKFGLSSLPYSSPPQLAGGFRLPFMFVPYYRLWVVLFSVVVCAAVWYAIEKTRVGAYLRAATENPEIVRSFGINVPLLVTLTYAGGVGLAGLAGVLAAPIYQPQPFMGQDLLIVVFAVVVIGGMGSLLGSIVTGFIVGLLEGLVAYIYPPASTFAIFVLMVLVLLVRPAGLFGWMVEAPKNSMENEEIFDIKPHGVWVAAGIAAVALFAAYFFIYSNTVMQAICFAMFALSVGFLVAYVGLLSFGHAMFFGAGGYTVAYLSQSLGLPNDVALLVGIAGAAALSYLVGLLGLRRQGIYFAMITLGMAQLIYFMVLKAPFSHGEDGLQNIPLTSALGFLPLKNPTVLYTVVSVIFIAVILGLGRIVNSPFGEVLKAVRDSEQRAISLGYEARRYKLIAFIISGALAGLAGGLKTIVAQSANLSDVHWSMSGQALLMVLIGGMGTLYGPAVGAIIVFGLTYYFAVLGEWVLVAQGTIFIICVLAFRRGVVGEIMARTRRERAETPGTIKPVLAPGH